MPNNVDDIPLDMAGDSAMLLADSNTSLHLEMINVFDKTDTYITLQYQSTPVRILIISFVPFTPRASAVSYSKKQSSCRHRYRISLLIIILIIESGWNNGTMSVTRSLSGVEVSMAIVH